MSDPEARPVSPVFFERRTYRRRRLQDAARILPLIGAFAWLIPLLWPRGAEDGPPMSQALIYVFTIWVVLIVVGAILSYRLTLGEAAEAERSQE
ncbi:hypothetical protein SAMN05421759_1179 [Roseivivax lentus]|uniref:Uncharacterized protein n=1 Tax=Roseivivax lentus TaxID=633194 RepID=A0A1N7PL21_9RHOB|nr:hypothetical protein [Roseivivax lentus]SIT11278.1 hypothetical protein SAMN05421759_1179 [Roseivivax lentus]